jgi:protein-S-isoprenylcysteine O-methyltransferase Ste14
VGEREFFQIAAGLLPVLLFGGVLISRDALDRTRPPSQWQLIETTLFVILGVLAIYAEIRAINGAVTEESNRHDRLVVIYTILIAMVAIVLRVVVPPLVHWTRSAGDSMARALSALCSAMLIALVVWQGTNAVDYLDTTVRQGNVDRLRAKRYAELGGINADIHQTKRTILDTQRRDNGLRLKLTALLTKDPRPFSVINRLRYNYLSRELEYDFDLIEQEGRWLKYLQRRGRFLAWHKLPVGE